MSAIGRAGQLARPVILGTMLSLGAAACGSSNNSPTTATTSATSSGPAASTTPSSPSTGQRPSNLGAAKAAITSAWQRFFAASSGVDTKVSLLQNGSQFRSAIQAGSSNPLASTTAVKVTNITFASPTSANVTYDITSGGKVLLANQSGMAVQSGGKWLVSDSAFCALLSLQGGQLPAACPKG